MAGRVKVVMEKEETLGLPVGLCVLGLSAALGSMTNVLLAIMASLQTVPYRCDSPRRAPCSVARRAAWGKATRPVPRATLALDKITS